MKNKRERILPQSLPPRGLSREQAAAYVGISPSLFDMLVKDGRMPAPKRINSRTVWDRLQVDEAFTAIPSNDVAVNPWDEITASRVVRGPNLAPKLTSKAPPRRLRSSVIQNPASGLVSATVNKLSRSVAEADLLHSPHFHLAAAQREACLVEHRRRGQRHYTAPNGDLS